MYVYLVFVWDLWKPAKGLGFPGTGVTNDCKLPSGFRKMNSGPLQDQSLLITTEASFKPHIIRLLKTVSILCGTA